jgi:hypothetical protein
MGLVQALEWQQFAEAAQVACCLRMQQFAHQWQWLGN